MSTNEQQQYPTQYHAIEAADERQITADADLQQALVHDINGKKQISYAGIKWIAVKMAQSNQALQMIGNPVITLDRDDPDNQEHWHWRATVKVRNTGTGLESFGVSEQSYLLDGRYDNFGRTKAASKAERNAIRKQIPEPEILDMIKAADGRMSAARKAAAAKSKPADQPLCECAKPKLGANRTCVDCRGHIPREVKAK